jgi:hypothetical protein
MGNSLDFFAQMSLGKVSDHMANIIVGIVLILGSLLAIPLARNFDRKNLLIVSAVGVSACLFLIATYFYLRYLEMSDGLAWLPLTAFLMYIIFFMVSNLHVCRLLATTFPLYLKWQNNYKVHL